MRFLKETGSTVLFTTQETDERSTADLQFITDGAIILQYVDGARQVSVPKFQGFAIQSGTHTFRITHHGIEVYPELEPNEHAQEFEPQSRSAGVPEIDELLHGGIERGTTTIISGPTGIGKTTLGTQFMKEAAGRGDRSVIYRFAENVRTLLARSEAINIPVRDMLDRGTLHIEEINALEDSPREFAQRVKHEVEENGTDIVMIDDIAGYRLALQASDASVLRQLHSLCRYLRNVGVTTFLIDETTNVGEEFQAPGEHQLPRGQHRVPPPPRTERRTPEGYRGPETTDERLRAHAPPVRNYRARDHGQGAVHEPPRHPERNAGGDGGDGSNKEDP